MNTRMLHTIGIVFVVFFLIFSLCPESYAQNEGWRFNLVPAYLWVPGFSGNLGLGDTDTPGDSPAGDSFVDLEFGYLLHGEAWYTRFGAMADILYVRLGKDAKAGLPNLDVGFQTWLADFAGMYRLYNRPLGDAADGRNLDIDLIAGVRYISVELDIDLKVDLLDETLSLNGEEQWADPIFGGRIIWDMSRRFTGTFRGDIGGGVNADLTWSATGTLAFNFTQLFNVWAGYRALGMEYEIGSGSDRFLFEMTFQGPIIGLGFNF